MLEIEYEYSTRSTTRDCNWRVTDGMLNDRRSSEGCEEMDDTTVHRRACRTVPDSDYGFLWQFFLKQIQGLNLCEGGKIVTFFYSISVIARGVTWTGVRASCAWCDVDRCARECLTWSSRNSRSSVGCRSFFCFVLSFRFQISTFLFITLLSLLPLSPPCSRIVTLVSIHVRSRPAGYGPLRYAGRR